MKKDPLFFIALLPPEDLQGEITAFKHYISDQWDARHALNSPPHLTLQPPFAWLEHDAHSLKKCLVDFASQQKPFSLELKGFGAFSPAVVFVKIVKNRFLERLFQDLVNCLDRELGFSDPRNRRPFHPHMTIAHRDLDERDFPAVWAYFKEKIYERRFEATMLALLRNVQGKWEVEDQYPMQ